MALRRLGRILLYGIAGAFALGVALMLVWLVLKIFVHDYTL